MTERKLEALFMVALIGFMLVMLFTICSCGRPDRKQLPAPEVDYVTIFNYSDFQSKTYKAGDTVVCEGRGKFRYEDTPVTATATFNMGSPIKSTGRGVVATTVGSLGTLACMMSIEYTGNNGVKSDVYVGQSINSLAMESTPD